MPFPSKAAVSPSRRYGQNDLLYRAEATPFSSSAELPRLPGDLALQRLGRGLVEHRLDPRDGGGHRLAVRERAGGPAQAVGHEGPQRDLEPLRLDDVHVQRGFPGVHGPVQDQRAHVAREQLGVPGAQVGAVGLAEVGELGVAERGAEHVHVPGGVGGADIRQQGTGLLLAAPREQLAF